MNKIIIITLFFYFPNILSAKSYDIQKSSDSLTRTYIFKNSKRITYKKPNFWRDVSNGPRDMVLFIKNSIKKENLPMISGITGTTLLLIHYDREIYKETQSFGKKMNISNIDKTKTFISLNGLSLFRGPTDLGSAMYFIGDGWVNIGLFSSFKIYSLFFKDYRASSTANQLAEGLLITGFATQFLKWSSGRQMPKSAGDEGTGQWHPYSKDYIKQRSNYDTFPSGHLATGIMTVTILAENYPEKTYIKPLGYSLLGLLSFEMINNGVHWASDYPLGLAIGYEIGKTISSKHILKEENKTAKSIFLFPYITADGTSGIATSYKF